MKERLKQRRQDEGFTLIELLIVIIILAILATIVIFAVGTTTKNAAAAACQTTVKTVQTALEAYKAQSATATYPAKLTTLTKKTGTNGPWLKQLPPIKPTKSGWAIVTYKKTTGTFKVETKKTKKKVAATTVTAACKGA